MEAFFNWLNGIIWSNALIALCLGAGLWFTLRTRVMQVRGFAEMCRLTVTGQKSDAGVSSFQALAISMAGRMGIGNIAGVATAIAYGGPGAVFWMWVMGFLGASTSYIECTLAQIYKEKDGEGRYRGGPAYYIEKAMGLKWYAVTFALATVIAAGFLLPGVQANAIADSATNVLCGATGFGAAWLATILWNEASRRLSASLCGQLIVSETLFALLYAFVLEGRWPMPAQWLAAALFTLGILASIKAQR